jgi:hypothetical protein
MWKAIKWGLGIMLGIFLAYALLYVTLIGGVIALIVGSDA